MLDPAQTLADNLDTPGLAHLRAHVTAGPHPGWQLEWTSPYPSLSIEREPGQWLPLASRRAPLDEARGALGEARGERPWPTLVVLLGAGLGYAVDVVERDAPPETRVLVIEPSAACAAAMLSRRDWRPLVDAGRLHVVVGPVFDGASDLWRQVDARAAAPLVVEQPVVARVRPDAIAAARKVLDRASFDAAANDEARETLGGRYLVNTLCNLRRIVASLDLRALEGSGRGRAAVVCGAGPSLNGNLETVRAMRDRVILIVVDTALRPTLEAGLAPDYVVALDPAALNARHLSGLTLPPRTLLVSEAALDPSAFDSFGARVAFFRVGGNDPWPWLLEQGVDVPVLAAWGSVLTSAFAFAELLGCDPIALAGADLAWTGGQPYCRGTMFEVDWARVVLEGQPLPHYWRRLASRKATEHPPDVHGRPADTAPHLVAFRDWLVERAARSGRRVVNLTGAGILHGPAITDWEGSDPIVPGFVTKALEGREFDAEALFSRIAALRDDRPPLSSWIEGYARSLDRPRLDVALNACATTPAATPPPVLPRGLVALPEALAILRAARDGATLPEWATTSAAWHLARARIDTATALGALLRPPRLGATVASGDRLAPASGHLHLLYDLQWPQAVLEAVSAMLIDTASRLRAGPPARRLHQRFRSPGTPEMPQAHARHAERRARTFIASIHATRLAAESDADAARTALALLDAASAALGPVPPAADGRVCLTVSGDGRATRWRAAAPVAASTLADALRGAILGAPVSRPRLTLRDAGIRLDLAWDVRTVDRDVLHREYLGTASARTLTDEGLPRCLIATAAGDGTAIATPRGQTASYQVGDEGAFERMAEWPAPIVGEAHGPHGQAAWTFTTPQRLMFREHDGAGVTTASVAFQTYSAVWWQNHVVLSTSDGVWTWMPGEIPVKIAATPPGVIAALDDARLEVDPLPIAESQLTRMRLTTAQTLDLRTGTLSQRPLSPFGQRWSAARAEAGAVTTHPEADAIVLDSHGQERVLVWPSPRTAVRIGRALVFNTTRGEVVLVPEFATMFGDRSGS